MPVTVESASPAGLATPSATPLDSIVRQQLNSLDDTDAYASAWTDIVVQQGQATALKWGGRGQGGRGLARRTHQPRDIVVEDVHLEYISVQDQLPSKVLLEGATLKLLAGHVYALVGRNGVGKSTLLRRIQAGKIPGFPPHVAALYIPQELPVSENETCTALELVQNQFAAFSKATSTSLQYQMDILEKELEDLDDTNEERMEALCEELSNLQDAIDHANQDSHSASTLQEETKAALAFYRLNDDLQSKPYPELSPGQRKKVALSVAVLCASTVSSSQQFLLCLDEPTNHLDVAGLVQLRQFLLQTEHTQNRTVLCVSHDTDLLNDVATDTVSFSHFAKTLSYYPGNYFDYQRQYAQRELHILRQQVSLDKKRNQMVQTIHHLQDQPAPKRGGNRKKAKMIAAQRKKLERQGIEKDEKGHRWTQQKAETGIKKGSLNSIDASTRKDLSTAQLLKLAEASVRPPPDKAVQFVFRNTNCAWGEPLIMAMDVGHGYGPFAADDTAAGSSGPENEGIIIRKKPGYLFDCVDLCIKEQHKYCLLGENASGKSTLLRLLAKRVDPLEGSIHHATGLQIGYFGQETMDQLVEDAVSSAGTSVTTALSYLKERFSQKTEKELRGELTNFGLSPAQVTTNICFLSGGERCRLCLAALMSENPHVLCLDNPTTNLDVESVEALIHGLQQWNGTVVMVSHDVNMIRLLEAQCAVLVRKEGKLRRIDGTIDDYLKTFKY